MKLSTGAEQSAETRKGKGLLKKYEEILFSVANQYNTTEQSGAYRLQGLGTEEDCIILSVRPEEGDWRVTSESCSPLQSRTGS